MRTRGLILRIPHWEAVHRALSMIGCIPTPPPGAPPDAGDRPINYRLEESNGGDDPTAPHCAGWSYGDRTPTSDCIALVLWASGVDRKQPGFHGTRGEWLNCASLLDDAAAPTSRFCRHLLIGEKQRPGDWVLTRSHIGMLIRVDTPEADPLVIDCSPRHGRKSAIGIGGFWSGECRVLRPLVYQGEE